MCVEIIYIIILNEARWFQIPFTGFNVFLQFRYITFKIRSRLGINWGRQIPSKISTLFYNSGLERQWRVFNIAVLYITNSRDRSFSRYPAKQELIRQQAKMLLMETPKLGHYGILQFWAIPFAFHVNILKFRRENMFCVERA